MRKKLIGGWLITLLLLMGSIPTVLANSPVSGAAFTSVNEGVDGTGHCANGNPNNNCNIYDGKQYVWLNGGPSTAYVGDGSYFFAVLEPGGQADPNDGATNNLSDDFDAYTNRTFSVSGGTVTYGGSHDFANNKIRLADYADTSNPGGVYILAICSLADGYPVDASDCKYDAFKVKETVDPPGVPLTITKDAEGSNKNTYTWTITKDVDKTLVEQAGGNATFNYTVKVTHDAGTISDVKVTGTITVFNPNVDGSSNTVPVTVNAITDTLSDGTTCTVTNGGNQDLTQVETHFGYTCNLSALPQGQLDNTASVSWSDQFLDNGTFLAADSANFTFKNIAFEETKVDDSVNVTDTLNGTLGTVKVGDDNPTIFTYSKDFQGVGGTCTDYDNTATFTTNSSGTQDSASQTVTVCVGLDLTASKTANPTFTRTYNWSIAKNVDKTLVEQVGGGTAVFNYTVSVAETGFVDSAWQVNGTITVTNPNDWEDIVANVSDAVDNGGVCTVTGGANVTIPKSSSKDLTYTCTYAAAPTSSSGTNTATVNWDKSLYFTPTGSAQGTAPFAFTTPTTQVNQTITVNDTFNGTTTLLGTLVATDSQPLASKTFQYSHTVAVPTFDCVKYTNTAKIVETGQSDSKTVEVCGPAKTGALTIGFWQNKNGQGIITGGASTGVVCNSGTWLRGFAPFQDLSTTANCSAVGTYVTNIIKAANASGTSMNPMLKAQMLATALDVYFSDPAKGGNKINAPAGPIGAFNIDLTKICKMIDGTGGVATCGSAYQNVSAAFGGANSLTVSQMLAYAASQSNAGGITWYANVKATQELAKNAFDAINNQVAFAP